MNKTIVLLEDGKIPNNLLSKIKVEKNIEIFSLNYDTHLELSKQNIVHTMAEIFLTVKDQKLIDDMALRLATTWHHDKNIQNFVKYEEILLPSLIENEVFQYLLPILRNAVCILRIIEKIKPSMILSKTLLNNFLEQICKSKNISFNLFEFNKQMILSLDEIHIKFNLGPLLIKFSISRIFYNKIKSISEKIINFLFNFNPNKNSIKKNILLLDFNPTSYKSLLNELSKLDKNIILLNQRRPAIWNLKSFLIMKKLNCKIFNLNSFNSNTKSQINSDLNKLENNLNLLFKEDSIFNDLFLLEQFTLWPSIKKSFSNMYNSRLSESVKRILLIKKFFMDYKFNVILEWAETGQEEKEILSIANQQNIPSIMLQHAIITTSPYWIPTARFLGDFGDKLMSTKQAVWGEAQKEYVLSLKHKNENIFVSGSPRFDEFFNVNDNKLNSTGIILFAPVGASTASAEYHNSLSFENFDNFVRQICKIIKNFPDKKLIIKPHPSQTNLNNVQRLINEIDPNITISYSTNIIKLIKECDVLITTNNSTIALESIILKKPTISLQTEHWALDELISKSGAILPISNIDEIEPNLKKILTNQEFKNKLLKRSEKYVNENVSFQGNSSKILSNFLNSF
jgi:glycosyltransferase involved in cell wall biosynthesis